MKKYCAGLVTYNPDLILLSKCIISIVSQVNNLIIIDNGSKNEDEIIGMLRTFPFEIDFYPLHSNKGVAYALNCIGEYAKSKIVSGSLHLIKTLYVQQNMIQKYALYENIREVGMICPYIQQRIHEGKPLNFTSKYKYIQIAITSGSMLRVAAWENVNGFWNDLFIDRVDDDICLALRDKDGRFYRHLRLFLIMKLDILGCTLL